MFKKRKNSAVNSKPNVVEDLSPFLNEITVNKKKMEGMDDATLEFQHKRIYDRLLLELEHAKSIKAEDRFRLSILGVIATIGFTFFITLYPEYHNF